jgi:hypothetical protein
MFSRFLIPLPLAILLVLLPACDTFGSGDDDSPPSVTGSYETERLVVRTDTGTVDALARGSFIEMRLRPDNTVTDGVLFVPAEFTEEDTQGSRRIEFGGTWSRPNDRTITFEHQADTFIRETEWQIANDTLRTETGEVRAVLVRRADDS